MNIVLVDDDFINRLVLTKYFEKIEKNDCVCLNNGKDLIEFIENNEERFIDYIFLDLRMPILDGFEFLDWFTKNKPDSETKIVVLTSSIDSRDQEKVESYDCVFQFFQKPITPEKLYETLI